MLDSGAATQVFAQGLFRVFITVRALRGASRAEAAALEVGAHAVINDRYNSEKIRG